MLTARERWEYDHHGLLHLPALVPPEDVEEMRAAAAYWHSLPNAELPPPLVKSAPSHPNWNDGKISGWVDHPHYRNEAYQRVLLHPEILRIVIGLTGRRPVLVGTSVTKCERGDDAIPLHGGSRPGGSMYRVVAAGSEGKDADPPPRINPATLSDEQPEPEIYDGFINVAVSLVDNPPGSGFVCIPGTHHSNFRMPPVSTEGVRAPTPGDGDCEGTRLISVNDGPPTILNLPAGAGDVIVFSESMSHGARAWKEEYPRFTLFNRFRCAHALLLVSDVAFAQRSSSVAQNDAYTFRIHFICMPALADVPVAERRRPAAPTALEPSPGTAARPLTGESLHVCFQRTYWSYRQVQI